MVQIPLRTLLPSKGRWSMLNGDFLGRKMGLSDSKERQKLTPTFSRPAMKIKIEFNASSRANRGTMSKVLWYHRESDIKAGTGTFRVDGPAASYYYKDGRVSYLINNSVQHYIFERGARRGNSY